MHHVESADLCNHLQVKMLQQRWERESRRSRRKQELRRSGSPPLWRRSHLTLLPILHSRPSFLQLGATTFASAGGECTTVSCSLGKYFATSRQEEEAQPAGPAIFAPSVLSDQGGEILPRMPAATQCTHRTAQRQFNHGFGVSDGPCDAAKKYALLHNCQC